jgi:hypothetical protein
MATNIKIIRLLTGEEVLGEVVENHTSEVYRYSLLLKNPVRVVVVPNKAQPDQPGVAFAPFCHWTKDTEIEINGDLIVATMNPVVDFINQYNATFGGLVVPDSKIILPGK